MDKLFVPMNQKASINCSVYEFPALDVLLPRYTRPLPLRYYERSFSDYLHIFIWKYSLIKYKLIIGKCHRQWTSESCGTDTSS